jgi:hypothetical protein
MGKKTTRQHFVPRTYLRTFAHERKKDQFFLHHKHPKLIENGGTSCTNIINLCVEGGLYDLPGSKLTEEQRTMVDSFYKDAYEDYWPSAYAKLVDESITTISTEDRRQIIGMVSSLYFRNRLWNVFINNSMGDIIERGYGMVKNVGKDSFDMFGETVTITGRTVEEIKNDHQERDRVSMVLKGAKSTIDLLRKRLTSDGIQIVKLNDPTQYFLTSDCPVSVRDPGGGHTRPSNPENFMCLPLDHKHLLQLIPGVPLQGLNKIFREISNEAFIWNIQTFEFADRFLMGSEEGLKSFAAMITRLKKTHSH